LKNRFMGSRILNITGCCFVAVWPIALHGQVPNAETITQSVLDQHKNADPTNSARALTGKSQEFDISKIMGLVAVALAAVNICGGFLVTHRMLSMFKKKEPAKGAK